MNKAVISFVIALVIILLGIGYLGYQAAQAPDEAINANTNQNDNTNTNEPQNVPISQTYPQKVVYTLDATADVEALKRDCSARNGSFNECGTPCAPDAPVCATVCAYTCELLTAPQPFDLQATSTASTTSNAPTSTGL